MSILNRFPSYEFLYAGAVNTFKRFPLTLLCAFFGTIVAVMLADSGTPDTEFVLQKLLIVSALGLPLFPAITLFGERQKLGIKTTFLLRAVGILAMIAYFFSLPQNITSTDQHLARFFLLGIGLHFLVAVLPFIYGNQNGGFWQYNTSLFLRLLLAALYSSVMYLGLTIALAAADYLFGIEVKEVRYLQLFIVIAGSFNTWVFLSGIPGNLADMTGSIKYPKGLKLFTQYILLPLVILYFVILIAYECKIVFTWNWPKGWVSHLVLWYSVVGILSLLLLHPLRKDSESRWVRIFSKWFFWTLVPLVVMLILAIMRRISDYGFTENRYFVLGMAIGLSVVVVYFIFSRAKDIRIIPIILCCLPFLASYGPWSAFAVSERSQKNRLEAFLIKNEILVDGVTQSAAGDIDFEDIKEMSSIIDYLVKMHGVDAFADWFTGDDLKTLEEIPRHSKSGEIAALMGFQFTREWAQPGEGLYFNVGVESGYTSQISGHDYLIHLDIDPSIPDTIRITDIGDDTCMIHFDREQLILQISFCNNSKTVGLSMAERFFRIARLYKGGSVPLEEMTFTVSEEGIKAKVILRQVSGVYRENEIQEISTLDGHLLIELP